MGEGVFRTMADTPVFNNGVLSVVEKGNGERLGFLGQVAALVAV